MYQKANGVERYGWNGGKKIDDGVVVELVFWKRDLRDLNGWEMRALDKVVYYKDGKVEIFSNTSNKELYIDF